MLQELKRHFVRMGWYSGTHDFLTIRLEGGFEAFSGKASETWEYRWVIKVHENQQLNIPEIEVKGKRAEEIDEVAARVLKKLKS
jgi:hypothetical protein